MYVGILQNLPWVANSSAYLDFKLRYALPHWQTILLHAATRLAILPAPIAPPSHDVLFLLVNKLVQSIHQRVVDDILTVGGINAQTNVCKKWK